MLDSLVVITCLTQPVGAGAEPLRSRISLNGTWQTAEASQIDAPPREATWRPAEVPGVFGSVAGQKRWLRRQIDVPAGWRGRRLWICYDGVRWNSRHFVNGRFVGGCFEGFCPFALDVTDTVRFGQANELLVGVCDWQGVFTEVMAFDRDASWYSVRSAPHDRILSPIGGRYGEYGVWADVALLAVPSVHVRDVAIHTSVRKRALTVVAELANDAAAAADVTLGGRVVEADGPKLPHKSIRIPAGKTSTVSVAVPWPQPKMWSHETPHLYHLQLALTQNGRTIDRLEQRFGFREFWCDGPWFYLNGIRVTCRASSMWPLSANSVAEATDRLRRLKAINVMCFRTHTQPWRQLWYDAADEVGMLMIPEGPVWNDDDTYRVNDDRFWGHFGAELRGMVRRMKNNPSVVAWSLENELWGPRMNDETPGAKAKLVELGRKMRQWDPTRPFMYESDGDPDGVADIVGIHYPHEMPQAYLYPDTCYWLDHPVEPVHWFANGEPMWRWDRRKPLYIGEYLWCPSSTPAGYSVMYGDRAYEDYGRYQSRAIGRAWSMQTRAYRYHRVSGLCPWTCAGGSLDVKDDPMAAAQAESMRPLAAFVKEYNTRFYGGRTVRRTLHIVNDTLGDGRVSVDWRFDVDGKTCAQGGVAADMEPADLVVRSIEFSTPKVDRRTEARLIVQAKLSGAPDFNESIPCSVYPPVRLDVMGQCKVGLLGGGPQTADQLARAGLNVRVIDGTKAVPAGVDILIVAPNALSQATSQSAEPALRVGRRDAIGKRIDDFLDRGGRLLLLAQNPPHVRVGAVQFILRQATMTFPLWSSHPLLTDVEPAALQFWGPNHIAANAHLRRDACPGRSIVVSGGTEGIAYTAVAECRIGRGVAVVSGLRLLDAMDEEPAAGLILRNALSTLARWQATPEPVFVSARMAEDTLSSVIGQAGLGVRRVSPDLSDLPPDANAVLVAQDCDVETVTRLLTRLENRSGLVWWHRPSPAAFAAVMKQLDRPYHMVPATGPVQLRRDDPMTDGLAQADLYWIDEHPRGIPDWGKTPIDESIIDSEVVPAASRQIDASRALPADALTPTGSEYNRRQDGGIMLCSTGSATGQVDFEKGGPTLIGIRAKGWRAKGVWPRVSIRVDDQLFGHVSVTSEEPDVYARVWTVPAGRHRLDIAFINDVQTPTEDRNVWIGQVYVQPSAADQSGIRVHAAPGALVSMPIGKARLVVDTIRWDQPAARNIAPATRFARSILAKLGAKGDRVPEAAVEAETIDYEHTAHNRPTGDVLVLATDGWARVPVDCERPGSCVLRILAWFKKGTGSELNTHSSSGKTTSRRGACPLFEPGPYSRERCKGR